MLFHWLANRLILKPSRHPIAVPDKERRTIRCRAGELEFWVQRTENFDSGCSRVLLLKFPGMSGRAEYASLSPLDHWSDLAGEVWTLNYPGYGGSTGPADVAALAPAALALVEHANQTVGDMPTIIAGTSLGTCPALLAAARYPCDGLILRNPVPIRDLIQERAKYNWWNGGAARWVAKYFPDELDPIRNAGQVAAPILFIQSAHDRLVPVKFQERVISAHRGPQHVFRFPGQHHELPTEEQDQARYREAIEWLRRLVFADPSS